MKKMLITLATIASVMAFAGPKADIEKADKLLSQNKVEEAFKVLKASKFVKGEEESYGEIQLALAANAQNKADAIKYYKEALKGTANQKIVAEYQLFLLSEKNKDKIMYLESINKASNNQALDILANLAYYYDVEKMSSKVNEIMKIVSTKEAVLQDRFNYFLGEQYLAAGNEAKGVTYLNKVLKSKDNEIVSEAYFLLGIFYYGKDVAKGEKYINAAVSKSPKYTNLLERVAEFYLAAKKFDKTLMYLEKAYAAEKEPHRELLKNLVAFSIVNKKDESKYVKELKDKHKIGDIETAFYLYNQFGLINGAEKYAKKAVKSHPEANAILGIAEAAKGNKKEAISYLEKAVKANVPGAKELLEQLKKAK